MHRMVADAVIAVHQVLAVASGGGHLVGMIALRDLSPDVDAEHQIDEKKKTAPPRKMLRAIALLKTSCMMHS